MSEPAARKRLREAREKAAAEREAAEACKLSDERLAEIRDVYSDDHHIINEMLNGIDWLRCEVEKQTKRADYWHERAQFAWADGDRLGNELVCAYVDKWRLDEELSAVRAELAGHLEAESADAAAGSYAGRAEEAEAALAELRQEWGVQNDVSGRVFTVNSKAVARDMATSYGRTFPKQPHRAVVRFIGEWRDVDATPRTALERAADADRGCLCPHSQQPDGTLTRDGVLAVGCPVHDPDADAGCGKWKAAP